MAIEAQDILDLIPDCSVEDAIVTSIIAAATEFIDNAFTDCDILSDVELENITKYVAAHILSSGPCRQTKREKLGEAEVEYDKQGTEIFESTTYGRIAIALDRCGILTKSGKQAVKIRAITSFE